MFDQYLYTGELDQAQRLTRLDEAARRQFFFDTLTYVVTGVGSQDQDVNRNVQRPMRVIGATTDIANSRWMLSDTKSNNFTSDYVPVRSLCNFQAFINPWLPFPCPIEVDLDIQVKAQFINNGPVADANGTYKVILCCEEGAANDGKVALEKWLKPGRDYITGGRRPLPFDLMVNVPFNSVLNEPAEVQTVGFDDPLLVVGITSELTLATLQIIQGNNNYAWSPFQIPVWCFSGDTKSSRATVWILPRPVYLPPKATLNLQLTNVGSEPAGQINFLCVRP